MNGKPDGGETAFRALVVDDEKLYTRAICRELAKNGVECDAAFTAAEALDLCRSGSYQAILLDHRLPDDDGIRLIPAMLARQPGASLVLMTAYETIQNAIQAIRLGAEDYIVKETSLRPVIERALEIRRRHSLRNPAADGAETGLTGSSPAMELVRGQIAMVAARKNTTVLLTGETGSGKEVAARQLHRLSSPSAPFISVDCVALPGPLVESLLFGHEKGSFTGAHQTTRGAFEEAAGGTIFLDEIGDMDQGLQGKLLRVLEMRKFQRVGSVQEHGVGARIIAATNRDLQEQVARGRFRFDLYQRLTVFPINLPPLRDRREDIIPLAVHFMGLYCAQMGKAAASIPREVGERLQGYDYPGNVRELRNVIERATIIADGGLLELKHLPERLLNPPPPPPLSGERPAGTADFISGIDTLETLERKMILNALEQSGGVKSEAAKRLGLSRYQLLRRLEKYGMKP
jgi:DNA-binding NtrC family response regulator